MEWQAATAIETKTFFGLLLLLHFSSCKAHLWCSKLKVYLQLGGIPEQELKKLYVHFFLWSISAFSPHSFFYSLLISIKTFETCV